VGNPHLRPAESHLVYPAHCPAVNPAVFPQVNQVVPHPVRHQAYRLVCPVRFPVGNPHLRPAESHLVYQAVFLLRNPLLRQRVYQQDNPPRFHRRGLLGHLLVYQLVSQLVFHLENPPECLLDYRRDSPLDTLRASPLASPQACHR
jgi:hypothetical protein